MPAERGDVLFIKGRYLAGDMGVKNVRTSTPKKNILSSSYEMIGVGGLVVSLTPPLARGLQLPHPLHAWRVALDYLAYG